MTREKIIFALRQCQAGNACGDCPYKNMDTCRSAMHNDAADLILYLLGKNTPYLEPAEANTEDAKITETWTREKVLAEAKRCVCGGREQDYGSPEDSFGRIAALWTIYTNYGYKFDSEDVAAMLALLKIARIAANPGHMDSWVDLAGYAACGGEITGRSSNSQSTHREDEHV